MPLSEDEKVRVRNHLGYPQVSQLASIQFGLPKPLQTAFLLETALDKIVEGALATVRHYLQVLDDTEARMLKAQKRLAVRRIDEIETREDEIERLDRDYVKWAHRLADLFGVPLYPFSTKFRRGLGAGAENIPIRH